MKNKIVASFGIALIAITLSSALFAKDKKEIKSSPNFEKIKSLEGSWTGTHAIDGKEEGVKVNYQVTSGGTAVVETLFPKTPHEMVSVYFQDGSNVMMTHYCMLGNQPRMKLVSSKGKKFVFDFVDGTNMKSKNDPHMGGLTLTFKGKNKLQQDWEMREGGKTKAMTTLVLKRE